MEQVKDESVRGDAPVELTKTDVDAFVSHASKTVASFHAEGRLSQRQADYLNEELRQLSIAFRHATRARIYCVEYTQRTLAIYRKVVGVLEFVRDTTEKRERTWQN